MKRNSICLGSAALLAVAQLVMAAEVQPATGQPGGKSGSVDGKTVIVQTGIGGSSSGGGPLFKPGQSIRLNFRPGKMEKGSYLGISASPVTGALRSQLALQPGVGLVVESVEKDSPAAEAGVEQYDVLQQFNDQILVDSKQLGVLVRLAKPGDTVSLKVLRKGQPTTVSAKLVERDVPAIDSNDPFALDRQMFTIDRDKITETNKAMELFRHTLKEGGSGSMSYADKGMTLQIEQRDGDRHLTAKDASGKVLFDGPINTEDEKKKLPPEVAKRLKDMEPASKPAKTDE